MCRVMENFIYPNTFKRLDQVGDSEKTTSPLSTLSCSHAPHLEVAVFLLLLLFLFCEFFPTVKNNNCNLLEISWDYLTRVFTPFLRV